MQTSTRMSGLRKFKRTKVTIISRHANYGNVPITMEQRDHVETIGVSLTIRSHN
jgi:septum formation topological specificity factor MinE